jgi:TPR repeat protein
MRDNRFPPAGGAGRPASGRPALALVLSSGLVALLLVLTPPAARPALPGTGQAEPGRQQLASFGDRSLLDEQFSLGLAAYQAGDPATAIRLWERIADQGHVLAQYNLGVAHAQGNGTAVDLSQALRWWRHAALQGNTDAQYNLGLLYSRGQGVRRNLATAAMWWYMAAIGGDPAAQYNLGVLSLEGDRMSSGLEEALWWWQLSAGQGFEHAVNVLERLEAEGVITGKTRK